MPPKKLYHGTAKALGIMTEMEGLNPEPFENLPEELRPPAKSKYSEEGYVYFFDDLRLAKEFACGSAFKIGFGLFGEIFEIDSDEVEVEPDPLLPRGSWRHKGKISKDKIRIAIKKLDCEKEGLGKNYWKRWQEVFG